MSLLRRTFLKLTGGAATAIALSHHLISYAEQEELLPIDNTTKSDWILDKGHYYTVTVPRKKLLKNESFDKPVLFILQEDAIVDSIFVNGFTTVVANEGAVFSSSYIDCKKTILKNPRAAVLIDKTSNRLSYLGNQVDGGPSTSYGLEMANTGNHVVNDCNFSLSKELEGSTIEFFNQHGYVLPKNKNIAGIGVINYDARSTPRVYSPNVYPKS